MDSRRVMQVAISGVFGLLSLVMLLAAVVARKPQLLATQLVGAAIFAGIAAIAYGAFAWQRRTMRRAEERIAAQVQSVAQRLFDAPAGVRPGYNLAATLGSMASFVNAMDSGNGFTTDGTYRGVAVSAASHVSVVGRQFGEMFHVYSHVLVDVQGLELPFRLARQAPGSALARLAGVTRDAQVGDPAFDRAWTIDADEALAREVLDAPIRAKLTELRAMVGQVSQDWGAGSMSLLLTRAGLALRWPGELDDALAAQLRDLLLAMRERLLAYAARAALAQQQRASGYRVDATVGGEREEAALEVPAASGGKAQA